MRKTCEEVMLNLIANPKAAKGKGKKLLKRVEERLRERGREFQTFVTSEKGEATALAGRLTTEGEREIVAVGGDGTVNDVLTGMICPEECTLGIITAGTGNDFAAAAGLGEGMSSLEKILENNPKPTDFIQFDDGRRSLNIAGLGMDVDILVRCERAKVFKGKIKYFLSLLKSLVSYRGVHMNVEVDGESSEHNALIAAVCNGKQLGGGIPLCPPAKIDDGDMELVVIDYPKRSKLFGALIKLMKGKVLSLPFAHRYSCDRAVIRPDGETTAQFDGELYPVTELAATLIKGRLKVFR